MNPLTRFGTYGFLTAMLAVQVAALGNDTAAEKADRAKTDLKKSARAAKSDIKKGARKATGQDSTYKDVKDDASDAVENVKDEAAHQKKKLEE